MAKESKYARREPGLFDTFVAETKFEYPICIEYTEGLRYGNGNVEAFFENGIRAFISTRGRCCTFSKTKFVPHSSDIASAISEYELFIKTLLYIHKEITPDDFNKRYEEMDKLNATLDSLSFEDDFKNAYENNVGEFLKKKEEKKDEESIIKSKEDEADHPF